MGMSTRQVVCDQLTKIYGNSKTKALDSVSFSLPSRGIFVRILTVEEEAFRVSRELARGGFKFTIRNLSKTSCRERMLPSLSVALPRRPLPPHRLTLTSGSNPGARTSLPVVVAHYLTRRRSQ